MVIACEVISLNKNHLDLFRVNLEASSHSEVSWTGIWVGLGVPTKLKAANLEDPWMLSQRWHGVVIVMAAVFKLSTRASDRLRNGGESQLYNGSRTFLPSFVSLAVYPVGASPCSIALRQVNRVAPLAPVDS